MESKQGQKVSGGFKLRDWKVGFQGAAMAGPWNQNPKGRRLTLVLLKQGLVLLPLSLNTLGKTASFKVQI
jgi:hypothetical protein